MLYYLTLIYVIFRIVNFIIVHRGQNKQVFGKMIGFLALEIVLFIVGIITVVPAIFGGAGDNKALGYTMLIGGAICLIVSGRVGVYVRKLAKGINTEIPNTNPISKKQFNIAKIFTTVSFLIFIFAWPFYQTSFKFWSALIYAMSLLLAVLAIRYSIKSKSDINIKKTSIWGLIVVNCIIGILSVFMLLGIAMKV